MKSNLFKVLIIILFVSSCNKKKWNSVNIHSTSNDSVTKSSKVFYQNKYSIYGAKRSTKGIILDSATLKQSSGKFVLGIIDNNSPLNKLIVFYDNDTLGTPMLNDKNIYNYCLLNEIVSMRKKNTILNCSIDNYYEDVFGEYHEKYINYSFTTSDNDTIALQKSIYSKVNDKLVTFHFLTETEEKFYELQEMSEQFASQVED
ncbi:hypothetical protein [Winogradskyella haliclonae]|uniref:Lipoprotein n=1 Tax=Winogradskyella haliclonae TaxID=2048558 RepID=A0ABQ2C179_9FLAO|nr:hypothetical protein [Winogradskyella haliclonae]GGI58301.1 hypothetical protein GCM10011444_26100 [Winogradskyella haliclonae]